MHVFEQTMEVSVGELFPGGCAPRLLRTVDSIPHYWKCMLPSTGQESVKHKQPDGAPTDVLHHAQAESVENIYAHVKRGHTKTVQPKQSVQKQSLFHKLSHRHRTRAPASANPQI